MKTEELPYHQIMEARDMHLSDVSTHVKVKGGEMRKQVPMCYSSLHTCDVCTDLHMHTSYTSQAANFSLSKQHIKTKHAANIL